MAKSPRARSEAPTAAPTEPDAVPTAPATRAARNAAATAQNAALHASAPTPATRATENEAAAAAPTPAQGIKVRAIEVGYYDDKRRRIGDVFVLHPREGTFTEQVLGKDGEPKTDKAGAFITKEVKKTLTAEEQFSAKWMERVHPNTPEKITTAKQDLRQKHDELLASKAAGTTATPTATPSPTDRDVIGADT